MTRRLLNVIAAALCALAALALLVAWTDTDGASREAWFWWLKAGGFALSVLAIHLGRAAGKTRENK